MMKEKMLGPRVSLCVHASGDTPSSFTMVRMYTTRQGNDHYICYNTMKVAIPNGCPTSTAQR